jgi:hypothetical protein
MGAVISERRVAIMRRLRFMDQVADQAAQFANLSVHRAPGLGFITGIEGFANGYITCLAGYDELFRYLIDRDARERDLYRAIVSDERTERLREKGASRGRWGTK